MQIIEFEWTKHCTGRGRWVLTLTRQVVVYGQNVFRLDFSSDDEKQERAEGGNEKNK